MIEPPDIQELLDNEPFHPFRIQMSDGKHYDVANPGLAVAMESNMFLALPKDRWKLLAYENMTSLDVSTARPAARGK